MMYLLTRVTVVNEKSEQGIKRYRQHVERGNELPVYLGRVYDL